MSASERVSEYARTRQCMCTILRLHVEGHSCTIQQHPSTAGSNCPISPRHLIPVRSVRYLQLHLYLTKGRTAQMKPLPPPQPPPPSIILTTTFNTSSSTTVIIRPFAKRYRLHHHHHPHTTTAIIKTTRGCISAFKYYESHWAESIIENKWVCVRAPLTFIGPTEIYSWQARKLCTASSV